MSTATVIDPDNVRCRLEFTMTLGEWKEIRKTLKTNSHYTAMAILEDINDLIGQLEKTYYATGKGE